MSQLVQDPLGFYRVSPTPDVATLKQLYAHDYYVQDKPQYLEKTERELAYWEDIWSIRLSAMEAHLVSEQKTILDVGASGGFFLNLAKKRGWQVVGVEPSIQSAAFARREFHLDIFNGYLEEYDHEGQVDAVHMSLVLEHVREPLGFLRKALSLLRPGGCLWVEVPNDFNALQAVITTELKKPQWWVVPEHHLNYFSFDSLAQVLTHLGTTELDRMASFPMEMFVLMGLDYIGNDSVGSQAHQYRMNFERHILSHNAQTLAQLYRTLAKANFGRTCNLLVAKES